MALHTVRREKAATVEIEDRGLDRLTEPRGSWEQRTPEGHMNDHEKERADGNSNKRHFELFENRVHAIGGL